MAEDINNLLSKLEELTKKCFRYREDNERLRQENTALRAKLSEANAWQEESSCSQSMNPLYKSTKAVGLEKHSDQNFSTPQKIALLRKVFRGREDVYAYRWVNKEGRSGYSPACKGGYYSFKKSNKSDIEYLPLSDSVLEEHLCGNKVIGIYPLFPDETCCLLAADFDKEGYEKDALTFKQVSQLLGVPAYIERSRSGNGAHVWIFLREAIPAAMARKLGFAILTKALEKRHQIELTSYDRFFPNQDTLPKGGFGNLIALPLQKQSWARGGSIFVDDNFHPVADQWTFLSSIDLVAFEKVKGIVEQAQAEGTVVGVPLPLVDDNDEDPWTLPPSRRRKTKPLEGPFPETIRFVYSNQLFVPKEGLSPQFITRLKRLAAFQNPEFFKHQAMRLSVYSKPRVISCSEHFGKYLALPRGCLDDLNELLASCDIHSEIQDERSEGEVLSVHFHGQLREMQHEA
jgi:hypothetical protein